ncbi:MAG: hypothetical protein P4L90_25790 [Rhodopila sp.]|nr:hypothetical protein [Rhodopila sp.]
MNLPGYDTWKLECPYDMTAAEEREQQEAYDEARDNLREQIAATLQDERGKVYLADIRQIVIEELNKLQPQPGEPAWQTKTPVPIPALG